MFATAHNLSDEEIAQVIAAMTVESQKQRYEEKTLLQLPASVTVINAAGAAVDVIYTLVLCEGQVSARASAHYMRARS